jgi:hypothetical protein
MSLGWPSLLLLFRFVMLLFFFFCFLHFFFFFLASEAQLAKKREIRALISKIVKIQTNSPW